MEIFFKLLLYNIFLVAVGSLKINPLWRDNLYICCFTCISGREGTIVFCYTLRIDLAEKNLKKRIYTYYLLGQKNICICLLCYFYAIQCRSSRNMAYMTDKSYGYLGKLKPHGWLPGSDSYCDEWPIQTCVHDSIEQLHHLQPNS